MTVSKTTTKTSRSATKKTSARKTTAKKTPARKAPAKKATTKKAAPRKKPAGNGPIGRFSTQTVNHDQIALRAYEIWQQQGQPMGLDTEHWYQAERELRG